MYEPTEADRGTLTYALAVAAQVAARVPHLPHDLKVHWVPGRSAYDIDLYFHRGPANVYSFAHEFGAEVAASPHGDNAEKTFTEANAAVEGIHIRAWSLDETAHLEGLQLEQHHQLDDPSEPPLPAGLIPQQTATVHVTLPAQAAHAPLAVQS